MRSTGLIFATSMVNVASGASRSSCTMAQRRNEPTTTSVAPAMRWVWESLPGRSMSNEWWACLTVDTVSPRATMRGITLANSVVLPEPLQPARPIMRMQHHSKLLRGLHGAAPRSGRDLALGGFLLRPQAVVLLRPVGIDGAIPHAFEGTFHAHGADVDV